MTSSKVEMWRWHLAFADTDWMNALIICNIVVCTGEWSCVQSLGAAHAFMSIQTRQQTSPPGRSCLHRWLSPHGDCSESHCSLYATSLGNFTLQSTVCVKGCVWNVQQYHLQRPAGKNKCKLDMITDLTSSKSVVTASVVSPTSEVSLLLSSHSFWSLLFFWMSELSKLQGHLPEHSQTETY